MCVIFVAWADVAECFSIEAEDQVVEGQTMLDRLSGPLEALLGAFEPEGEAAA